MFNDIREIIDRADIVGGPTLKYIKYVNENIFHGKPDTTLCFSFKRIVSWYEDYILKIEVEVRAIYHKDPFDCRCPSRFIIEGIVATVNDPDFESWIGLSIKIDYDEEKTEGKIILLQ